MFLEWLLNSLQGEKNMETSMEKKQKETVKKENDKCYITFSDKMIASTREHNDKTKIDRKTGEVMKICAIKLPSKDYRSMQFL